MAGNPVDGDGAVVQRFQGVAGFSDGGGRFLAWSWFEICYSHNGCLVVREDLYIALLACGLAACVAASLMPYSSALYTSIWNVSQWLIGWWWGCHSGLLQLGLLALSRRCR